MFDLGWSELLFVAVIAVLVLGPKELPTAMRTLAKWVRKARLLASDVQRQIDDVVRESELEDLRREANKIAHTDIGRQIDRAVDPDGSIARGLRFDDRVDPTGPAPRETAAPAADPGDTPPKDDAPATGDASPKDNGKSAGRGGEGAA
jgi:sec-independent protein translocase protein TatB